MDKLRLVQTLVPDVWKVRHIPAPVCTVPRTPKHPYETMTKSSGIIRDLGNNLLIQGYMYARTRRDVWSEGSWRQMLMNKKKKKMRLFRDPVYRSLDFFFFLLINFKWILWLLIIVFINVYFFSFTYTEWRYVETSRAAPKHLDERPNVCRRPRRR